MASWALSTLVELIPSFTDPDVPMAYDKGLAGVAEAIEADFAFVALSGAVIVRHNCDDLSDEHLLSLTAADDLIAHHFANGAWMAFSSSKAYTSDQIRFVEAMGELLAAASKNRALLQKERHSARHDSLTGLANRAKIEAHIDTKLKEAPEEQLTVFFVDLDGFKATNDTLGHIVGDRVLSLVAERLLSAVRERDIVGRLSGDEFVVVSSGIPESQSLEFARRIQDSIRIPVELNGQDHVISASIGIAQASADDSAEDLVGNADIAMYRAKERGHSRIEVFDAALRSAIERKLAADRDLRRAIADEEFSNVFQPIVGLPDREIVGWEALARWDHPTRGQLLPIDFIAQASEIGVSIEIDRRVIEWAMAMMSKCPEPLPVSVNLSVATFADEALTKWLGYRLDFYGIGPGLLTFEVAEDALLNTEIDVSSQVDAIRRLGVSVVLDDFGTGYSPLTHLQAFSLDGVKIDCTFVDAIEDKTASAIVGAVMYVAERLGIDVVAEGVESEDQVAKLLEIASGIGTVPLKGQGYLFGSLMSAQEAIEVTETRQIQSRSW
jgi:diguanylate cyclase (GGDEF)-like protein